MTLRITLQNVLDNLLEMKLELKGKYTFTETEINRMGQESIEMKSALTQALYRLDRVERGDHTGSQGRGFVNLIYLR